MTPPTPRQPHPTQPLDINRNGRSTSPGTDARNHRNAHSIRRGSGGQGYAPGGDGLVKEVEVLIACTLSIITERRSSQPWGLWGGEPGASGEQWLLRGGDEAKAERLPTSCTVHLQAGDVLRVLTPGGGGWGARR